MIKNNIFFILKVGSGVGSGSIGQRCGCENRIRIKMSRIPNTDISISKVNYWKEENESPLLEVGWWTFHGFAY